jgi:hypothetical protein
LSRQQTLKSLQAVLEDFLDRAVAAKRQRLTVPEGIDRLDDIAGRLSQGADVTDEVGDWFARHNWWLTDTSLENGEIERINSILGRFKGKLRSGPDSSPAEDKIHAEIDRWREAGEKLTQKLVLKRGPEIAMPELAGDADTIAMFDKKLTRLTAVFKDYCQGKKHILSVADDLLKAAHLQGNKEALILSAFIIYYLKQNGYKVEPYVKKLREAETALAGRASHG